MKKFNFPLNTVLKYKSEVLENLTNEYGKIMAQVNEQEEVIAGLERKYREENEVFNEKKSKQITVVEASMYASYFRSLEVSIKKENKKLDELKAIAEEKRRQVVEAKIEKATIEKLKEKKIEQYNKDEQKAQELFIEEFVANSRSS